MASFNEYNGALEIFKQVGCVGEKDNWIFGGFIDKSKSSTFTSSMIGKQAFGAAGYMAGYEIGRKRDISISKINGYFALLFNFTENGVGIMPLDGNSLSLNPKKLEPVYDDYVFYNYQEISEISVRNFWGIRKGIKRVTIELADKRKLYFFIHMVERFIPYQKENMEKFVEKYQK